jgi:hypothetical protein
VGGPKRSVTPIAALAKFRIDISYAKGRRKWSWRRLDDTSEKRSADF